MSEQRGPQHRQALPGQRLAAPRPDPQAIASEQADAESDGNRVKAGLRHRRRQIEPAHIEEGAARQDVALARAGQGLQHGEVPEEQLQQQRHVAHDLDVDRGQPRDQPVGGEPRDADDEAETVAATMPSTATSSVLSSPTQKARP